MVTRRLLSSLAGSCVVAALMGCNAIIGNEDVDYTETLSTKTPTPDAQTDVEQPTTTVDADIEDAEAGPGDDEDITDAATG